MLSIELALVLGLGGNITVSDLYRKLTADFFVQKRSWTLTERRYLKCTLYSSSLFRDIWAACHGHRSLGGRNFLIRSFVRLFCRISDSNYPSV